MKVKEIIEKLSPYENEEVTLTCYDSEINFWIDNGNKSILSIFEDDGKQY